MYKEVDRRIEGTLDWSILAFSFLFTSSLVCLLTNNLIHAHMQEARHTHTHTRIPLTCIEACTHTSIQAYMNAITHAYAQKSMHPHTPPPSPHMHIQACKHAACTHVILHACTLTCIQAWHACVGRCWRVEPKEGWCLFLQHHTGHTRNKNYLVLVAKGLVLEVTSALGIHRHKYSESVRMNMQTWRDTWISNFYQLHAA